MSVSFGCLVAYGLWAAAVALCMAGEGTGLLGLRVFSIIVGMAAVTATVRTYFVVLGYRIKAALIVAAEGQATAIPKVTTLR